MNNHFSHTDLSFVPPTSWKIFATENRTQAFKMRVDCEDCALNFPTKSLYIKHIKSKQCQKTKRVSPVTFSSGQPANKRPRIEIVPVRQSASSSPQLAVLQSQIAQLGQQKQKQVVKAIPISQLSDKQKETLKRISQVNPRSGRASAVSMSRPIVGRVTPVETIEVVTLASEEGNKPRRRTPYTRTSQRVNITKKICFEKGRDQEELSDLPIITEFRSDGSIAADEEDRDPIAILSDLDGKEESTTIGCLKIKSLAKAFQNIANVSPEMSSSPDVVLTKEKPLTPVRATPKENCPYCRKIFSKSGISQHIDFKHKVKCERCDSRYLKEDLGEHLEKEHKTPCLYCEQRLFREESEGHLEEKHKEKCQKCEKRILNTEMQTHILNVHEVERCSECAERFETTSELEDHIISVHLTEQCDECVSKFRTEQELLDHKISIHPSEFCDECEAVFGRNSELEEHKEKVHPKPTKFMNFNGGMFMMMVKDDDDLEEEDESETKESDSEEKERVEKERALLREQEEVWCFLRETLLDLADDVVKKAMTGTVLFALRFESEEENITSDDDY